MSRIDGPCPIWKKAARKASKAERLRRLKAIEDGYDKTPKPTIKRRPAP